MENTPPNNPPRLKRMAAIIVGLLLVGAIAAGVILLIRNMTPKTNNESGSQTVTPGSEVIKAVRIPGTIKSLEKYTQQTNAADTARVIFKSDTHTYTISVPAKESVLFVAPTPDPQANVAATEEELERFIISQGYDKTDNTGQAATSPPKYFTFKSSAGAACQVMSSQPTEAQQMLAFYQIACVDSAAISGEYSSLEMLFSLYKKQGGMPAFTNATQTRTTEDNKSLSIVTLNGDGTKTSLLFAAIDNNWEFIGNVTGNQAGSNGKFSISAETRSKIDDSRWGNFLKKNLQITQT